jgi:hypothetical protein
MRALIIKQAGWAGLCALVISGCASTKPQPPPVPGQPQPLAQTQTQSQPPVAHPATHEDTGDPADAGSNFDNLEIVDASLNAKVTVLRVGSERTPNNLLSVFAGLKNATPHRLVLEAETIYKDKAGNPLNAGSWIPVVLKPREEGEYRSASISEEAVDFLVRVRLAPNASGSNRE